MTELETNPYYEEPYDWRVGPYAGMTWLQWAKEQIGDEWVEDVVEDNNQEQSGDAWVEDVVEDNNQEHLDENNKEHLHENNDIQFEEDELICPPTPRPSHHSVKRQLCISPKRVHFGNPPINFNTPEKKDYTKSSILTPKCPEPPRKARTRAERRAPIELDIERGETDNFTTPQKKERRTDYWVRQDTLLMNRARTTKSDWTEPTMSIDDEPISPFNSTKLSY